MLFRRLYLSYVTLNYPDRRVTEYDIDSAFIKKFCLRLLTRTLLLCYTLLILKPALPVIQDKLAHRFWHEQHMKVVHTVNGKQHVHYEIANGAKEDQKDKSSGKWKVDFSEFSCILPEPVVPQILTWQNKAVYSRYSNTLPFAYCDHDYIPPKA